jgi:site-specific DNA recombinase
MDRPKLEEMLRIVVERLVSLVIILNPDRLARDPLHLVTIMRVFAESGVRLEFVHGSSDSSPEGQLLAYCT